MTDNGEELLSSSPRHQRAGGLGTRGAELRQYRRTELKDRPSLNPLGLYAFELRYTDGEGTVAGALDGTFTAAATTDRPARHSLQQWKYAI
jgi:hypothetical protein